MNLGNLKCLSGKWNSVALVLFDEWSKILMLNEPGTWNKQFLHFIFLIIIGTECMGASLGRGGDGKFDVFPLIRQPLISWRETSVNKQQIICTVYTHVSASRRLGNIYCPISEYIHMNMTKQSCTVSTLGACFTSALHTKTETMAFDSFTNRATDKVPPSATTLDARNPTSIFLYASSHGSKCVKYEFLAGIG